MAELGLQSLMTNPTAGRVRYGIVNGIDAR